jgi:hypothetical protein
MSLSWPQGDGVPGGDLSGAITLGTGRTYRMQGVVHLVLFVEYLFLAFIP